MNRKLQTHETCGSPPLEEVYVFNRSFIRTKEGVSAGDKCINVNNFASTIVCSDLGRKLDHKMRHLAGLNEFEAEVNLLIFKNL